MKLTSFLLLLVLVSAHADCYAQTKQNMEQQNNPLLCDPENGVCEMPADKSETTGVAAIKAASKPVKIIYFTDPICSSCWGIEPQLRKLKLEFGHVVEIEYRMGGLLPDWSYNSGGISKPSDVAHHWDEVSSYYDMPIDGDIWIEDPLPSSYPPSIAFKAAQLQDQEKALLFLREIREMVFLQKKNITRWEHLEAAAQKAGLDTSQFKTDYEGKADAAFREDLKLAKESGVRGFPTFFISGSTGYSEKIYGFKPYAVFAGSISKAHPEAVAHKYDREWKSLFAKYSTLTLREFTELSELTKQEASVLLDKLVTEKYLTKTSSKNGDLWSR